MITIIQIKKEEGIRMVIKNFHELEEMVANARKKTVAVACAHDRHTLEAILKADKKGILDYILIGLKDEILSQGLELGVHIPENNIINCKTDAESAAKAVELVNQGKADFIQKGIMQTATLLKAVVNKQTGISLGKTISHVAFMEIPKYHKIMAATDGAMIMYPDLAKKKDMVDNAVTAFRKLGYEKPKVAAVCALEIVNPKMPETLDAIALKEMADSGELENCYLAGPISIDIATSKEAAEIKHYDNPVSGDADIILCPAIYAGNMMVKALVRFADVKMAGCIVGAKCPIALNSRSSAFEEKYYSLLVSSLLAD